MTAAPQLIVDGKPFLILGGELQNSSMTSARYMETVWQNMKDTGLNTVLGCVNWEDIEPREGEFDFSELEAVILGAKAHGLRLVLLWFGSFKNGISTYTPPWVKKNPTRFPRAMLRKAGGQLEIGDVLSIFHSEAQIADRKAFSTLMAHLRRVDKEHTVIMVQVENEIGLLGDSRDGSKAAGKRFHEPVPEDLLKYLSEDWDSIHADFKSKFPNLKASLQDARGRSWPQVFGETKAADEIFMAYHYAVYVEEVASAGRMEYPLPLYTNVWQNYVDEDADNDFPVVAGGGGDPGDYPSGGGVSNVIDIWHKFAPSLDFIAPDIYLNDYASLCGKYRHRNQALFIPEQRRDDYGARRIWKAFGSFQALGTSPFGIDTLTPETNPFTRHYKLLGSVSKLILDAQQNLGSSVGFFFDELEANGKDTTPPISVQFGEYQVKIDRAFVFGKAGSGAGMVINTGPGKFILIGWGFNATFKSATRPFTGILSFVEKSVVDAERGILRTERKLNGDETRSGLFCIMPNEEPDYGGFPICVTIPARTMIAEVEAYSIASNGEE
ncbi:hypothetical protein V502_07462 [Pseudogymnoascus sp. VKM F-4520 (FW-2644)]|nr:hypothetical protein V502_07462 [Pseudogymnoascus sp. VKM F-4520 (FW-2644)]